jgi:hypothetical protein
MSAEFLNILISGDQHAFIKKQWWREQARLCLDGPGETAGNRELRKGTAHEFDSEEAREAGRKGGEASHGGGKGGSSSSRGGSSAQHAKAGSHSHKND